MPADVAEHIAGSAPERRGCESFTRDEWICWWDHSVFLDVDPGTALARRIRSDGLVLDPAGPLKQRCVEGQRLYLEVCRPRQRATCVLGNTEWLAPPDS